MSDLVSEKGVVITEYDILIDKVVALFNDKHDKEYCESILQQALKRLYKKMYIR